MALATELRFGSVPFVVYNAHLESKSGDDLRLAQLMEIVTDSRRYSADTPVLIAGDFNTKRSPSPLVEYLLARGFRTALLTRTRNTAGGDDVGGVARVQLP